MLLGPLAVSLLWLHGDGFEERKGTLLGGIGCGDELEARRIGVSAAGAAGVAHDAGELFEQGAEAVGRTAVV